MAGLDQHFDSDVTPFQNGGQANDLTALYEEFRQFTQSSPQFTCRALMPAARCAKVRLREGGIDRAGQVESRGVPAKMADRHRCRAAIHRPH
jgi:hypothetical protein